MTWNQMWLNHDKCKQKKEFLQFYMDFKPLLLLYKHFAQRRWGWSAVMMKETIISDFQNIFSGLLRWFGLNVKP